MPYIPSVFPPCFERRVVFAYYTYNSDGIRTKKYEYNGNDMYSYTHNYVLDGSKILKETILYSSAFNGNSTTTLEYYYDESGIASFRYNGTVYHYIKNLQGDVIGIVNSNNGGIVVEYTYDAWGNVLSITGELASTVGQYNPFRYRGYYYDSETGLYYLNSRYYDAEVGRFINADGIVGANGGVQGYNMFAYCNNNPVIFADHSGNVRSFSYKSYDPCLGGSSGLGVSAGAGIGLLAFFAVGAELIESVVDGISDTIDTIQEKITQKRRAAAEEKQRSEAIEKVIEETKKLEDGQCLIVAWGNDKIPFIYGGVVSIETAIAITTSDMLAGCLSLFPSEYRNIAIVTPLESDAFRFIAGIGSIPYDDKNWNTHSPMPHYHTTPHILTVGSKEYDIHAFFLN